MRRFAFLLFLPFFPSLEAAERDDPATELASFKLADGFEATLFASEGEGVIKPIQIRFDGRGRLWVIGSSVYPQVAPGEKPNDKVLILEDTDGDGRSDVTTVFAEGLMIPTGLETLADGSGCYVGHGTELLFLKDHNSDGKADSREVVLRGFGTGDNHQNINSFAWGPTGELWFCQGLHSHARVETPFGIAKLDQAGIWRLDLRSLRLEGFYGSAAEPQNPWGFAFTDWGEPIELAGNNSSIIYPVPGLVKHPKPAQPTLIWPTGRGRKMSGGDIVGNAHFPDHWQGRLIVGGYINNAVWTMTIHDDGAGFLLKDAEPLVTSTHGSFRPVDVKFGPDGALYICDWFNPIIGHYQASFRHPDRDKTHGRIWRVTARGRPPAEKPELVGKPLPELAARLLTGPADRWGAHFAKRLLAEHAAASGVVEAMREGLSTTPAFVFKDGRLSEIPQLWRDIGAARRIGLLAGLGRLEMEDLDPVVRSPNPELRASAAAALRIPAEEMPKAVHLLTALVTDAHPRVRLHAIVGSTYLDTPQAIEMAMMAADQPTDKFIEYALEQAVFSLKPRWLPMFEAGQLTFDNKANRLGAFVRADGTADTLATLRKLMTVGVVPPAARQSFMSILAEVGHASDLGAILSSDDPALAEVIPAAVRSVQRRGLRPAGDLVALVRSLLARNDPRLHDGAWRLAGAWNLSQLKPDLVERAGTSAAALEALVAIDPPLAAAKAAQIMANSRDGVEAATLLPAFLEREGAAATLVDALRTSKPAPAAAAAGVRVLRERGLTHLPLLESLSAAAGLPPPRWTFSPEFASILAADVRRTGNAAKGSEIFRRAELTCVACHSVGGEGGKIGPALDAIGSAQPVDFIIGAVIAPQKEVKESFDAIELTTKTGEVIVGHRASSSERELTIRDPASGEFTRVSRASVASEKALGSLMPAGLIDSLTHDELRDLIAYLAGLGKPTP